jgi:hypothetical protein
LLLAKRTIYRRAPFIGTLMAVPTQQLNRASKFKSVTSAFDPYETLPEGSRIAPELTLSPSSHLLLHLRRGIISGRQF